MVVDDLEEDEIDLSGLDHREVEIEVDSEVDHQEVEIEVALEDQEEKINHILVHLLEINNISKYSYNQKRDN
jgi:hypothetical protein